MDIDFTPEKDMGLLGQMFPQSNGQPEHDEPPSSWAARDLTAVLDGTWKPAEPTVGQRTDGHGLLYPGKSHTVIGETESGKGWFACSVSLDEMQAGNHVLYIDFEDDEGTVVGRLLTLSAARNLIEAQFHYLRPESPLYESRNLAALRDLAVEHRPTLAFLDGTTEAMTMHGLNPLDNVDAAKFGRLLPRRLASAGAAVANLDHVAKDREGRGRYAIGAVHKLNGLDGASYILENRQPFGIGLTGRSTIRIAKDRPGQLRRNSLPSTSSMHWYGDLVLESHGEEFAEVSVEPPHEKAEHFRPTIVMAKIAKALTDHGPMSKRSLRLLIQGKHEVKDQALEYLILDGYVTEQTPHALIKPYEGASK
jgi:hypothetical protein